MSPNPQITVVVEALAAALDERDEKAVGRLRQIVVREGVQRAHLLYDQLQSLIADADARDAGRVLEPAALARLDSIMARRVLFRATDGLRRTRGGAYLMLAKLWRQWAGRTIVGGLVDAITALVAS